MNHPGVAARPGHGRPRHGKGRLYLPVSLRLGVGPGNVPCYIEKSANLERACTDLMLSKTFDNGMICASEQAVIVDEVIWPKILKTDYEGKQLLLPEQRRNQKAVRNYVLGSAASRRLHPAVVGKSANWIAEQAGLKVPEKTKILIAPICRIVGRELSALAEKSSPLFWPILL